MVETITRAAVAVAALACLTAVYLVTGDAPEAMVAVVGSVVGAYAGALIPTRGTTPAVTGKHATPDIG